MRILTHPVHTAWEYEFARLGHEIFSVIPEDFTPLSEDGWGSAGESLVGGLVWNSRNRPMPDNVKPITLEKALRESFDVCIVHTVPWLEKLRSVSCPIIYKVHVIPPHNFLPDWAEEKIVALTFGNEVTMNKIVTQKPIFKNVIRVPIDYEIFNGYVGSIKKCLTIAHLASKRPDKRLDRLNKIANLAPVDLLGGGNEGIPYAIGEAQSFEDLLDCYKNYAVFLEAGDYVSMSCREAMMTGMPAVIFLYENKHQKLFRDGENCLIVETEEEAVEAINKLLNDPKLRNKIGINARRSAMELFDIVEFRKQWNKLLQLVISH